MQGHDALDDDNRLGLDMDSFLLAIALYIRIGRLFNGLALLEHTDMFRQQLPVEGIGMVEIDGLAFLWRQFRSVIIIRVEGYDSCTVRRQRLGDSPDNGCLT